MIKLYTIAIFILTGTLCADDTSTLHRYFYANYHHFSGNIKLASDWYDKLFSTPCSIYSYKGYLNFLNDTNQHKKIVELMPSLTTKFENDPDIQRIFVDALINTKQPDKATQLILTLSQTFKTHPDIALRAAQTYILRREPENAMLTINAFLNNTPRRPHNFVFYFLQSHIHTQLNQLPQALQSIEKCLDMHPNFDKGWLLYASLQEKAGKIKEALSGYTTFLELAGNNTQIEQHLFTLMLKYKAIEDNKQQLISRTVNLDNALILYKQQRYDQSLAHINHLLKQQPRNNECKLLKIQTLSAMKRFKDAASIISTWIGDDQEKNNLWPKTLSLLLHAGMPAADIIEVFNQHPDNLWCNIYGADICMRIGCTNKAMTYLEKAFSCSSDNALKAKINYQRALMHYEENNYDLMRSCLEQAYELDKSCPHITNTLAYYWATKGKDTAKAQSLIAQSLQCDSTNPYFLDTQALIFYKEKKYAQAQQILEQLIPYNHGTMLLHLAKVHYALNNKENADTFTKKAELVVANNQEKKALQKMQLRLAKT